MSSEFILSFATVALSDPSQTSPFLAASDWLEGTLLGSIATTVAVIAVAAQGAMLLTGHLSARRGLTLLAGCFILFGSATLSNGILSVLGVGDRALARETPPPPVEPPPPLMVIATPTPMPPSRPYDPYAGAAVPQRR